MAEFDLDFNELGSIGSIADRPGYQMPPEAWSVAHNVRFVDGVPRRLAGRSQAFGTPGVAPHFLMSLSSLNQAWWLYTSLTKAYAYDGTTHTDITRASGGDYTAGNTRDWNGTILGGIPILNNGADAPQYWASYSAGTDLPNLPNWPASTTAKVIRAFGPQLVAFNITRSGTTYPHMVKFSHPADPGSVPSSWDQTDATKDTGENDLPDVDSGVIVDAMMLRGSMYIFKEASVWRMRYIGGRFVFAFDTYLETSGILAPRCVTNLGSLGQQIFVTQDDILVHNGATQRSIIDRKWRRSFFNDIDTNNYRNTFVFHNADYSEVWICYPGSGATNPNRALIWNYQRGEGAFSTADINFRNTAVGTVDASDTLAWESPNDGWEDDEEAWGQDKRRRIIACGTDATKFYLLDDGTTNDGTTYSATLSRDGLALMGRDRKGQMIVDFKRLKMFKRIWFKISGGPVNVRVGSQMYPDGPITWGAQKTFTVDEDNYLDLIATGRALCIEISTTASTNWTLEGYRVEFSSLGNF